MASKSSKYILAAGCSFTDEKFKSMFHPEMDVSFDKWPTILGDNLELLVKNVGACGIDNTQIYHRAVADIIENHDKIELVVIGWTGHKRFVTYDKQNHNPEVYVRKTDKFYNDQSFKGAAMNYYHWLENNDYMGSTPFEVLFSRMYLIQKLCDDFGIKHIQASLCGGFSREPDLSKTFNRVIDSPSFEKVNPSNIIGWPFLNTLGGFEFNMISRVNVLSKEDRHPNAKGHEEIAKLYYEKYKEIYL